MTMTRTMNLFLGGLSALSLHFATGLPCAAQEVAKTVESPDPVPVQPPTGKLPHALLSLASETGTFSQYAFLVDKKNRTLTVWQNAGKTLKLVGAWPTDIGQKPGDKLIQGDHRTPEGVYFFQETMDGRKVNYNEYGVRIFTLDYPNYFDKLERKSGNGIWFHAIPETKSLLRGSRGCVVVRNETIEHLAQYIELKRTPMVIVSEVEYMDPNAWNSLKEQLASWLEQWRKTWSGKDFEAYMAQYSERFRGNGMNKNQWRRFKEALAAQREFIEVALKDVQIFNQGPKVVFRFLQYYRSNQKQDFGWKIVYTLKTGDKWDIVGETWQALKEPAVSSAQAPSAPAAAGSAAAGLADGKSGI